MKRKNLQSMSNEDLEKLKIIDDMNLFKRIICQPAFWTFLVAVTATLYSWNSGLFETKSESLKLQTLLLQSKRDSLNVLIAKLEDNYKSKLDSLSLAFDKKVSESDSMKHILETLKLKKFNNSQLKKEVLSLVAEMRGSIAQYDSLRRITMYDQNTDDNWELRNNRDELLKINLMNLYYKNYLTKAIIYREKLLSKLHDIKNNPVSQIPYENPTNPIVLERVVNNLEYLALQLNSD